MRYDSQKRFKGIMMLSFVQTHIKLFVLISMLFTALFAFLLNQMLWASLSVAALVFLAVPDAMKEQFRHSVGKLF